MCPVRNLPQMLRILPTGSSTCAGRPVPFHEGYGAISARAVRQHDLCCRKSQIPIPFALSAFGTRASLGQPGKRFWFPGIGPSFETMKIRPRKPAAGPLLMSPTPQPCIAARCQAHRLGQIFAAWPCKILRPVSEIRQPPNDLARVTRDQGASTAPARRKSPRCLHAGFAQIGFGLGGAANRDEVLPWRLTNSSRISSIIGRLGRPPAISRTLPDNRPRQCGRALHPAKRAKRLSPPYRARCEYAELEPVNGNAPHLAHHLKFRVLRLPPFLVLCIPSTTGVVGLGLIQRLFDTAAHTPAAGCLTGSRTGAYDQQV